MGIQACLDTLEAVVAEVVPVRMQGAPFRRAPSQSTARAMSPRLFSLAVTGGDAPELTGFRARRRHLVDLAVEYPRGFGGGGSEDVVIAEDVALLSVALGRSNVLRMAGVGVVYPPAPHTITAITPEGRDAPVGVVVVIPFIVETEEAA